MEIVLLGPTCAKRLIRDMKIVSSVARISRMKGIILQAFEKSDNFKSNIKMYEKGGK